MACLNNANDKIQLICEQIKNDALEHAKNEARLIVEKAIDEAQAIKAQSLKEIEEEKLRALALIEKEKQISQNSIHLAIKQSIDKLKHDIVNLLDDTFSSVVETEVSKTDVIVKLIDSVCEALIKEGIYSPVHLTIGNKIKASELAYKLSDELKKKLANGPITIGAFSGGAEIKLQDKNLTIDVSDKAVKELFSTFLKRPDFRSLIFKE